MTAVYDPTDPVHLTPEQPLEELAAILAAGVRRALALRAGTPVCGPQQIPLESEQNGLDVLLEKSVHATRPVNATGEQERS
jgi:hypothetical protein